MKRAAVPSILVAVVLLVLGVTAEAQQPGKIPRIGYPRELHRCARGPPGWRGCRRGLRDLGYVRGQEHRLIESRRGRG